VKSHKKGLGGVFEGIRMRELICKMYEKKYVPYKLKSLLFAVYFTTFSVTQTIM
jgi:hypothetical protein